MFETLAAHNSLLARLRPRVGWITTALALVAACAPAIAASSSPLRLPAANFMWAGIVALLLGMRVSPSAQPSPSPRRRTGLRVAGAAIGYALLVALGALFVISAGTTLPPLGLIYQDAGEYAAWLAAVLQPEVDAGPPPAVESLAFLSLSLTRFWDELRAAPEAGTRGASLLVTTIGIGLTWIGALAFGGMLPRGQQVIGWSIPLLAALIFTAVLGNAGGGGLAIGIMALLLAALSSHQQREQAAWERSGTDYSDEIGRDVLSWSLLVIAVTLLAAWIVPLWPGNPIAQLFRRDDLPSGIAVLQRGLETPGRRPETRVGISTLPEVRLGESLERGPPEQVALRVRVGEPLPEGPNPRYWRARLLNIYTGGGWTADAQVSAEQPTTIGDEAPEGLVLQEIEDLRRDRSLLVGLADLIAVNVPAQAERMADGALAALVAEQAPERYRAISRPMELAALPTPDREEPDMSGYLLLPTSVSQRVRDLASIVSDSGSRRPAMERALLIERYLRELPYTYEVQPLPRGGDAVDQFLFEMRQGYCTYYASAMAVMARSIGIPARVAVGYATGEYDPATGTYIIREAEAHAWPELYIDRRWVIFEPTPVRPLPARDAQGRQVQPAETAVAQEQTAQDRTTGPLIWIGVLALVALVTAAGLLIGRPRPPEHPVVQAQLALERFGARAGVPWPVGATLHEYGALLEPHADGAGPALREIIGLVELARYGGRELGTDEQRRLIAASEQLRSR